MAGIQFVENCSELGDFENAPGWAITGIGDTEEEAYNALIAQGECDGTICISPSSCGSLVRIIDQGTYFEALYCCEVLFLISQASDQIISQGGNKLTVNQSNASTDQYQGFGIFQDNGAMDEYDGESV